MNTGLMFSSKKTEWETPQALFDELDREFGFTLDVCALPENAKCDLFFTPEMDGLSRSWKGYTCWMNPPYGREIKKWVGKAWGENRYNRTTVVCLLPARTDTRWFHDYIYNKAKIRFLKGRIKFVGAENSAPFPSMIAIYK